MEQIQSKVEQLRLTSADFSYFLKTHFKSLSDIEITLTVSKGDIDKITEELLKELEGPTVIYPDKILAEPVRFTQIRFFPFTLITLKEEKSNGTATEPL